MVADKAVTMVMSDEASEVRRVIYLQRDRERAVYAGDRGEHSEKVKQREAKKYLYIHEKFSRAVFKRSDNGKGNTKGQAPNSYSSLNPMH